MDHSKLSDFEINKLVAEKIGYEFECAHPGDEDFVQVWSGSSVVYFDVCNNPADAWPIILKNKIDIRFEAGFMNKWESQHVKHLNDYDVDIIGSNYDKNPLRAAMIVFLMMD